MQWLSRPTSVRWYALKSTAGTGYTYVTRKNRRNDPDRMVLTKYDPIGGPTWTSAKSAKTMRRGRPRR